MGNRSSLQGQKGAAGNGNEQQVAAASGQPEQKPIETSQAVGSSSTVVQESVAKTWNPAAFAESSGDLREYHDVQTSDYVLPSDIKEQDRLQMQHFILRAAFGGDVVCPEAKSLLEKAGTKVLDVGCANGFWAKEVKAVYPGAEIFGVDIAESAVNSAAVGDGITLMFGNVLDRLPFEDNTFDYVHQRLLVLGMPKQRFADAIRELVRVTKPGGWIELLEVDAVFYSPGEHTKILGMAFFEAINQRGLECYAATNLPVYVSQVQESVARQDGKLVSIPLNWGSDFGVLNGTNIAEATKATEDWMHRAMGTTREEYRELVKNCYEEWPESKSFTNWRTLYFEVKK
ncbi:hypothetical protein HDU84_006709 [Entophlyctis sp. JEL0112]|nr:hypothetical protein HDU84_006709 [Entophlyctis sp. JEL0112]